MENGKSGVNAHKKHIETRSIMFCKKNHWIILVESSKRFFIDYVDFALESVQLKKYAEPRNFLINISALCILQITGLLVKILHGVCCVECGNSVVGGTKRNWLITRQIMVNEKSAVFYNFSDWFLKSLKKSFLESVQKTTTTKQKCTT